MRVLAFGTFDLFHFGHLNILRRAKEYGDYLIAGVSTDKFVFEKKGKYPIYPQEERKAIVQAIRYVDEVIYEEDLNSHLEIVLNHKIDVIIWGDDWDNGTFDYLKAYCQVVFLPRTPNISSTSIKIDIKNI